MAESYTVIVTEPAEQDLEELLEYITERDGSSSAESMRDAIVDAIEALAKMPDRYGRVREVLHFKDIIYRRVVVKNRYRVMYKVEELEKDVYVVRILHVKRGPGFVKNALK
ncbi:MAG: type II toxin-antitoxin system RelE/ParE family toxin [Bacteroidota bacterium]